MSIVHLYTCLCGHLVIAWYIELCTIKQPYAGGLEMLLTRGLDALQTGKVADDGVGQVRPLPADCEARHLSAGWASSRSAQMHQACATLPTLQQV